MDNAKRWLKDEPHLAYYLAAVSLLLSGKLLELFNPIPLGFGAATLSQDDLPGRFLAVLAYLHHPGAFYADRSVPGESNLLPMLGLLIVFAICGLVAQQLGGHNLKDLNRERWPIDWLRHVRQRFQLWLRIAFCLPMTSGAFVFWILWVFSHGAARQPLDGFLLALITTLPLDVLWTGFAMGHRLTSAADEIRRYEAFRVANESWASFSILGWLGTAAFAAFGWGAPGLSMVLTGTLSIGGLLLQTAVLGKLLALLASGIMVLVYAFAPAHPDFWIKSTTTEP